MPESGSGWLRAPEGKPPSQARDQQHFHRMLAISGLFEGGRRRDETDDPACRGNRLSGIARRLRLDRHRDLRDDPGGRRGLRFLQDQPRRLCLKQERRERHRPRAGGRLCQQLLEPAAAIGRRQRAGSGDVPGAFDRALQQDARCRQCAAAALDRPRRPVDRNPAGRCEDGGDHRVVCWPRRPRAGLAICRHRRRAGLPYGLSVDCARAQLRRLPQQIAA